MIKSDSHCVENIMFTDKAHFDWFGNVNKRNRRYYSQTNPQQTMEKPSHSPRVTVWCAVSSKAVIGPYFFQNSAGDAVTINA